MLISLGICPNDAIISGLPEEEVAEQFLLLLRRTIARIGQEENENFSFSIVMVHDVLNMPAESSRLIIMKWNGNNDGAVSLAEWVLDNFPSDWDDEVEWSVIV